MRAAAFVGPSRGFGRTRIERAEAAERLRLQEEIERRIREEAALAAAEALRVAEELRVAELGQLRERLRVQEERRVVELSVPLRAYLSSNVMGELIDGLIEVSRVRPSAPLRFLGEFLINASVGDIE